jgi:hypothetical protein
MRMNSAKPRGWGAVGAISVLALIVAILGLVLVQGGVRAQGSFEPEAGIELSDYESDVNADMITTFNVPATDYNYKEFVSFMPVEFFPADEAEVPIGAKVGTLDSVATLGLLNGPCWTTLGPHFDLWWATTDTSSTITFSEQFENDPSRAHPGMHNGIYYYPDFIDRLLEGVVPLSRLYGYANVSGSDVTINLVVLDAGDLSGYPADWGRPIVTVLNNIGDPLAEPSQGDPITDFCTPLVSDTTTFGLSEDNPETGESEAGYEVRRNPHYGGDYTFRWYAESMPDADGDGIENYMDTCPFDVNLDPSPKLPEGDPDNDGIDSACDPDPSNSCWPGAPGPLFNDCDLDFFYNRHDICPMVADAEQADIDADDIGDACDLHPNTPDGTPIEWTGEEVLEIEGPAPGEEVEGETTLTEDASAGDTEIDVDDTTGFEEDDTIQIGEEGEETTETNWITDIEGGSAGTFTLLVALEFDHDAGEPVEVVEDVVPPTPTVTATPTEGEGTPTPTPEGEEATPTPTVEMEICQPVFPGTYNGMVRIDGQPADSGYQVTASIDGTQWGSAIISGGRYAMDIPDYMPSAKPCFEGGTITFELDGMTCTPDEEDADVWKAGIQTVDLTCAPVAPPVTTTPTPEVTATPPPATPTVTPVSPPPSGAGGLSGSSSGLPLWAMALASWAGLAIVAGLGTLVAAKRR